MNLKVEIKNIEPKTDCWTIINPLRDYRNFLWSLSYINCYKNNESYSIINRKAYLYDCIINNLMNLNNYKYNCKGFKELKQDCQELITKIKALEVYI